MQLITLLKKNYVTLFFIVIFVFIITLFIKNISQQNKIDNFEKDNSRLTEEITKILENYETLKVEIDELKQMSKK